MRDFDLVRGVLCLTLVWGGCFADAEHGTDSGSGSTGLSQTGTSTAATTDDLATTGSQGTGTLGSSGGTGNEASSASTMPDAFDPIPFREIPGLTSIVFYESSNNWPVCEAYEIKLVDDARLSQRLADPLAVGNYDFQGGGDEADHHEFYDVFFSDDKGNLDPDGAFLSITGTFNNETLKGPGFNICDIELRSGSDPLEYGVLLVQAFTPREGGDPATGDNAIDEDITTFTEGGHTNAYPDQPERIHLIIGFKNSIAG